jgi:hypothetical protein
VSDPNIFGIKHTWVFAATENLRQLAAKKLHCASRFCQADLTQRRVPAILFPQPSPFIQKARALIRLQDVGNGKRE